MQPIISCGPCRSALPIRRIVLLCLVIMPTTAMVGCGNEAMRTAPDAATPTLGPEIPPNNLKQIGLATANHDVAAAKRMVLVGVDGSDSVDKQNEGQGLTAPPPALPRKIIYDATIDLVVDSLNGLEASITDVVKRHGGFLSGSDVSSQVSTQRTATWRVRVPVDRFEDFVRAVGRLGEVRSSHVGSQDVTEEYFDLEARIRNKQEEEKRLLKHLADSTGKLEDILKVEHELTRVRGEVEQMQGRLRFLANRADLSTVTITATELKNYRPPEPVTLAVQIRTTFFGSLNALTAFGESLLLVLIALVPWIPVIAIVLLVAYRLYRSSLRAEAKPMPRAAPSGPGPA
jgi:hypothetical protein